MSYRIYYKGEPIDRYPEHFTTPDDAAKRLLWDNGYWGMNDDTQDMIAAADYLDSIQTQWKNPVLQDWTIEEEYHSFFVDIPSINAVNNPDTSRINVESFPTREEAIEFAQKWFGADENGMICIISST